MPTSTQYRFEDMVTAIGNAAAEVLLRSGGPELTFSTSARDVWVGHVESAVRRMVEEGRADDEALEAAQATARALMRFAAERAGERGDEITESDISEAIQTAGAWPFASVSNGTGVPAGQEADARRAAAFVLERQVLRIGEFLRELPEGADPFPRLEPLLALSRAALDSIQEPASFMGWCPYDGTRVEFDWSIKTYCCAMRHCPPSA
jgi:hypothetical protein